MRDLIILAVACATCFIEGMIVTQMFNVSKLSDQLDETEIVKEDYCNNYCKYPMLWSTKEAGMELCESDYCKNCPTNRMKVKT